MLNFIEHEMFLYCQFNSYCFPTITILTSLILLSTPSSLFTLTITQKHIVCSYKTEYYLIITKTKKLTIYDVNKYGLAI